MQNISDKELDKLFQEAAQKGEYPFDPAAWKAMNELLDEHPSAKPDGFSRKIIFSLVAVSLLVTSTLFYAGYKAFKDDGSEVTVSQNSVVPGEPNLEYHMDEGQVDASQELEKEFSLKTDNNQDNDQLNSSDLLQTKRVESLSINSGNEKSLNKLSLHEASENELLHSAFQDDQKNRGTGEQALEKYLPETEAGQKGESVTHTTRHEDQADPTARLHEGSTKSELFNQKIVETAREVHEDTLQMIEKRLEDDRSLMDTIPEGSERDFQSFPSRFGIKLGLSPDFTSIGYGRVDRAGFNYGLLFEYQIRKNLIVSTGVMLSRKIYSGNDIEYTFNSRKYTANKLTGDCRVIDIPFNVYYFIQPDRKLSFFAGAGVTSYLMLTEDYTYIVNGTYGPREFTQEVKGENNEWFKMLNISFGVQRKISNRMVLQVEPFLKAPLAGVGAGKVALASLGTFLSVKYSFQKKLR